VIGGLSRLRSLGMVAALAAGLSALADLGQQRTLSSRPGTGIVARLSSRPGTGIVARSRPAKRRRDLSALPDLGQQRTLSSRPGTGIVARSRPAKRRRDAEREMRAVLKRRRKNALRLRHWQGARDGC
jgi:hypothetical protein